MRDALSGLPVLLGSGRDLFVLGIDLMPKCPVFPTMALFFIFFMWVMEMMSKLSAAEVKM